jgi:hypothetical protein
MLVPLYGFVEGDTLGVLVLAHDTTSVAEVIDKLRASVQLRVDTSGSYQLFHAGKALPREHTVARAGLRALDRVDARREGG